MYSRRVSIELNFPSWMGLVLLLLVSLGTVVFWGLAIVVGNQTPDSPDCYYFKWITASEYLILSGWAYLGVTLIAFLVNLFMVFAIDYGLMMCPSRENISIPPTENMMRCPSSIGCTSYLLFAGSLPIFLAMAELLWSVVGAVTLASLKSTCHLDDALWDWMLAVLIVQLVLALVSSVGSVSVIRT